MSIALNELPRDDNGVVTGTHRLRHKDPSYSAEFLGVVFKNGVTTERIGGEVLTRLVAAMGNELDLIDAKGKARAKPKAAEHFRPGREVKRVAKEDLEPDFIVNADAAARAAAEQAEEKAAEQAAQQAAATTQVSQSPQNTPAGPAEPNDDPALMPGADDAPSGHDDLPDDMQALKSIADTMGLKVPRDIGKKKLKQAIRNHRSKAS